MESDEFWSGWALLQAVAQVLVFAAAGWRGGFRARLSGDGRSETGATQNWPWSADCQKKIARRLLLATAKEGTLNQVLPYRPGYDFETRASCIGGAAAQVVPARRQLRRPKRRFWVDCNGMED
jgi:hypothetical protein